HPARRPPGLSLLVGLAGSPSSTPQPKSRAGRKATRPFWQERSPTCLVGLAETRVVQFERSSSTACFACVRARRDALRPCFARLTLASRTASAVLCTIGSAVATRSLKRRLRRGCRRFALFAFASF